MAKTQRNEPCPCGSGMKAKRCCHGPIRYVDVRIMPLSVYRDALCELGGTTKAEFRALYDQLADLPSAEPTLQVPLPSVSVPAVERAVTAIHGDDVETFDRAAAQVMAGVDTVLNRLLLARAVVVLQNAGRIPSKLAAAAVIDLDREESALFAASVAQSIATLAGERPTRDSRLAAAG